MNLKPHVRRLAAAALLSLGAATSQAALLQYDFVVELDTSGDMYSGMIAFDDEGTSSTGALGEKLYELDSFSFDFVDGSGAAKTYTLPDLSSALAAMTGSGFQGIDADESSGAFNFLSAVPSGSTSFGFDLGNLFDTGSVTFRLRDTGTVPVPATALLAALGLVGAGLSRRRGASRG